MVRRSRAVAAILAAAALPLTSATSAVAGRRDTIPPTTPTNLSVAAASTTSVSLTWSPSTDNVKVAGYQVLVGSGLLGTTRSTSYAVGVLTCGASYTLGVRAYDAAGNVSATATVTGTTSACAPVDRTPPVITGTPAVGQTLSAQPGSWTGTAPISYAYGWSRCDTSGAGCAAISGANAPTYVVASADAASTIRVTVTGSNAGGSSSATSAPTTAVSSATPSAPPRYTVPQWRYGYSNDQYAATAVLDGNTVIDAGSQWSADNAPFGTVGLVWIGDYDNTTCSWDLSDSQVTQFVQTGIGDSKVLGYFYSDEPDPYACPNAVADHKTRNSLIKSIDASKITFIVVDSNSGQGTLDQIPLWKGAADYIGYDPYPCYRGRACDYSWIDKVAAAADGSGNAYWLIIQAFGDNTWRWPTPEEESMMLQHAAQSHLSGIGTFSWNWNGDALVNHPDVLQVISNYMLGKDFVTPAAVTGLTTSAGGSSSVTLSWTAATDDTAVASYRLYLGGAQVATTAALGYQFTGLTCGTTYALGVAAVDTTGNVGPTSVVSAQTSACPAAPVNSAPPTITGTTAVNSLLMASTGSWTNSPSSYAYQWRRCDTTGGNCTAIAGATAQGYTLVSADEGSTLRVDVTASNSAGAATATSAQTALVQGSTGDPVVVAAGDICGSPSDCTPTAKLIGSINPTVVLTLGDNAYDTGSATDYATNYDPNWGQYKLITKPAPGNHEYDYGNQQTGYFAYFNNPPAYYSYDVGSWHVISLNGEVSSSAGSAQETWLKNDLATHANTCTLAYWHEPRWSSGYHGGSSYYGTIWTDLYNGGADVVLNGHDHDYERFAPQDPNGNLDSAKGIREFVVGTGGASHYTFSTIAANSEARDSTSFGLLRLTLHASGYDWRFVPVAGASFTDSGNGSCH